MEKEYIKYVVILALTAFMTYGLYSVQAAIAHGETYAFGTNLYVGSRGDDVASLQSFLMSNGFDIPAVSSGAAAPGYFGVQTVAALAAYQRAHGLPATGFFGPLTRQSIQDGSGAAAGTVVAAPAQAAVSVQSAVSASPSIYAAPTYQPNATYANPYQYGSLSVLAPNGGEAWQKGSLQTIRWTSPYYTSAAYADVRLLPQTTCSSGYCPMTAYAPLTVATGLSLYQNSYLWRVGDILQYLSPNVKTVAPDGLYKIQICQTNTSNCAQSANSFTIYSGTNNGGGSGNSLPPVIRGIDAPTVLALGQTGSWTVHASDPENGALSYAVDWGDQPAGYLANTTSMTSAGGYVQTATFTHSYSTTGTFTVTFTVRDNAGQTAQSKATVSVGAVTTQALTVTSPNGGESWQIGTQHQITWTNGIQSWPYGNNGYVRITLDYRCPGGQYCTAVYHPTYIVQNSAPNNGSSMWTVGSATLDGTTGTTVPPGTYVITVCRYDGGSLTACDSSDGYFTIAD